MSGEVDSRSVRVLGPDGKPVPRRLGDVGSRARRVSTAARIDKGVALAERLYAAEVSDERPR